MARPKHDWAKWGRKGGKARLRTMTAEERREVARRGALALNRRTIKTKRQEGARRAVLARWRKYRAAQQKAKTR